MSKTLLLADDSVTIQKVVGISFANEDVALIAVDNGDDAIAKAREVRPDAILADVVMPGKNGYEVCEAIKADPALAHIPVLLLTGTFEAFDAERAERVGAAGHIAKPFESQTLVDRVMSLFASTPASAVATGTPPPAAEPATAMELAPVQSPESGAASGADAFDFFDDDLEAADVVAEPEPLAGDGSLEFSSESAFEFSDADLAPVPETARSLGEPAVSITDSRPVSTPQTPMAAKPSPADEMRPVQGGDEDAFDRGPGRDLSPDTGPDLPLDSQLESDSDLDQPMPVDDGFDASIAFDASAPPDDSLSPLDTSGAEDPFDFALEPAPSEESDPLGIGDAGMARVDVEEDDMAQATTLYSEGESAFDVASSDLGPVTVGEPENTVLLGLDPSGPRVDEVLEHEPIGDRVTESSDHASDHPEEEAVVLAEFDDPRDATQFATTDPIEGPQGTTEPTFAPGSSFDSPSVSVESGSPTPVADTAARAEAVLERIEPQLRAQLHDTLEKIAWESFSDLTDAIVRQSVEKVEEIAWEVIPQLVETLVREEIRKMKGEPPSDG